MFYALKSKKIDVMGYDFDINLQDIETLNQNAKEAKADVTKMSFATLFELEDKYEMLNSGAALGRNCGPLIVSNGNEKEIKKSKIAVPGFLTTANLLLMLYLKEKPNSYAICFDEIMNRVKKGEFDFGVIIHEGRFTYKNYDLKKILDLGKWWEETTKLPIPLGCIAI